MIARPPTPSPRARLRRILRPLPGVLLALALVLGLQTLTGRDIAAPDWVEAEVESRLARLLPEGRIDFDALTLRLGRDGVLRARLSDAVLRAPDGAEVARVEALSLGAAALPLLGGRVALEEAALSGATLRLRRAPDGRLGLGIGFGGAGGAPSLTEALDRLDAALADPRLAGLDRITADALRLDYTDARAGRSWTAEAGRLSAERERGTLRLSGAAMLAGASGTAPARLEFGAERRPQEAALSFGMTLTGLASRDIATQSPALAWLEALRAPISGGLRGWVGDDGYLGGLDATLDIGAGALQPSDAAEPIPFRAARAAFAFDPDRGAIEFSEISVDSPLGRATAEGRALMGGLDGEPDPNLTGQFVLSDLAAEAEGLFAAPLALARAETEFRLTLDPFTLRVGRLRVDDPQVALRARGTVSAGPDGWRVALDADATRLTPEAVAAHWPLAVAPRTRDWFTENVSGGTVRDAVLALRRAPGAAPDLYVDFAFEGARVRFADTLPAAEDAAGQFTLNDKRLAVSVAEGTLAPDAGGTIDIAGTTFVIPETGGNPSTGVVTLAAEGTITAALSLLDRPPLELMRKAGRDADLAQGRLRVAGTMTRPLGPGVTLDEMSLALSGRASGVSSDKVLPGRRLDAKSLDVSVTEKRLRIAGRGTLSGVPFEGSWSRPLGPGAARVEAAVTLSDAAARAFGVPLPEGMLSGRGPGQIAIDLPPGGAAPRFTLTSTLAGIGLALPQANWRLPPERTGTLDIAGTLGRTPRIDRLRIAGAGLEAQGAVTLRPGGGLDRLSFSRVTIGDWFDAPVTLAGRGAGAVPELRVTGGSIDLRGLGTGGGSGGGMPIRLSLERLTVAKNIALGSFTGQFVTRAGGLDGGFTAQMVGSGAPVTGQLLPQNGGTGLRLASDKAGDVLEATGILKTVAGGRMVLNLTPLAGQRGTYDGAVTVTDARLRDAPAIGALLDAISIVGIIDQLQGPGIYFEDVEARFRLSPERVVIGRSSATGPSMGISLDGYYDLGSGALDLQGVLSPIYVLNSIGSIFTRRGEGLLGFNFNIRGSAASPQVAVNPLSVFTPGMFREIFRRPPPNLDR